MYTKKKIIMGWILLFLKTREFGKPVDTLKASLTQWPNVKLVTHAFV